MKVLSCTVSADRMSAVLITNQGKLMLYGTAENIIRCVYTKREEVLPASPVGIESTPAAELCMEEKETCYILSTARVSLTIEKRTGKFTWCDRRSGKILLREAGRELAGSPLMVYSTGGEKPVIRRVVTVDGERNFVENLKPEEDHMAYRGKLYFDWAPDEQIHGLGQGEEGIYNYRGNVQYLYQHNMRIPIPFFLSDQKYGILADCGSLMTFNDDSRGSYLYLDMIEQLDYYFIAGESVDEIIAGYRKLTGKAVMLPKWAYGYVQSKEAYRTQEEIIEIAKEYRKRKIGLDCVVQDWNTWEDGKWGNKKVDKKRYPDLKKMNQTLHDMNVHTMVSVWPNMNSGTEDCDEMEAHGFLLNDYATYDAYDEKARKLYWKQAEEELFSGGFDSWWCDSTEPFSGPDWNGAVLREPWERFQMVGSEHKKFLRADRANLYAAAHAKGIYENQRRCAPKKRVLNLTRSGYAGSQRYGTMLWSGDTCATWKNFRTQITEGLNMCISGMPYWTLDIGAFFTVNEKFENRGCGCSQDSSMKWFWRGDYDEGVHDLGYRELYVRWFQYGTFLPMFRSHGTDTPREIWNFGEPGEMFYDALEKSIRLRYRLMPYIYSMAGKVCLEDYTMLRSLLFDFPEDKTAAGMDSQFMFGENLLICPVTEPMYYDAGSIELDRSKSWKCYLPAGEDWYGFEDGKFFEGGRWVEIPVTLEQIPVFVKAGSILPMEQKLEYASEAVDTPFEISIYPGRDTVFTLYEDAGDDYGYEEGIFNRITLSWKDGERIFTIGAAGHDFPQSIRNRSIRILLKEGASGTKERVIDYQGRTAEVRFEK